MTPRSLALLAAASAAGGCTAVELPAPPAVVLDTPAGNPTVAIGPDGTAYAAWVRSDSTVGDVWIRRIASDGTVREAVRVNDIPGDATPHLQAPPQVAVGADGTVHVVWQRATPVPGRRFPGSDLRYARSTDGGRAFAPAIYVNDDAGGAPAGHTFHNLLPATDGTIWVSWLDSRDRIPPFDTTGGTAHRVGAHESSDVRVARSTAGGFAPGVIVDRDVCPCCRTALAQGPDGTLYVAWRKVLSGDVRDIMIARSDDGGVSFGPPVRVHADDWVYPGCPHAGPALAVDAAGALVVAWYTGGTGRSGLWTARSTDGGRTFSPPVPLGETGTTPVALAALAADSAVVLAAWEDRISDRLRIGPLGPSGARARWAVAGAAAPALAAREGRLAAGWLSGDTALAAVLTLR
jgi:hypothetical protein